jgi:hypothetical protein
MRALMLDSAVVQSFGEAQCMEKLVVLFPEFSNERCRPSRDSIRMAMFSAAIQKCLFGVLLLALLFTAVGHSQTLTVVSPLRLSTSDPQLQRAFDWAKDQALHYVSSGQDPVKDWYEAALPGRNAFCMRDVAHQVMGAEALGLSAQNKNMLKRFAQGISQTKDWAGYWEIDREGKPSTADYVSDDDFWYNLPANFDVMNAALRMFMWTGDSAYTTDPVFLNFYRSTVTDYIHRWQLEPLNVVSRPRIMNRHLASGKFVEARGIPGYTEERKDFNLGSDLLAAEYRALRLYGELLRMRGSAGSPTLDAQAAGIAQIIETKAWSSPSHHYYNALQQNGEGVGTGDAFILYFGAATNPEHRRLALEELRRRTREAAPGIEEQSYRPEILFHLNAPEEAYSQIVDLSRPDRERRDYPEVSYAIIGSIVTGMMGVNVVPAESHGTDQMLARKVVVQTLPRLSIHTSEAELDKLPLRRNVINVRHLSNQSSSITNVSGPTFTWRASFDGSARYLMVNGKKEQAKREATSLATPVVSVDVPVAPGQTVTVAR